MQSQLPHEIDPPPILRRLEARLVSHPVHLVVLRRLPLKTRDVRPDVPLRVRRELDGPPLPEPRRGGRCHLGSTGDPRRSGIRRAVHADRNRAVRHAGRPRGDRARGARGDEDEEEDGGGISQSSGRGVVRSYSFGRGVGNACFRESWLGRTCKQVF